MFTIEEDSGTYTGIPPSAQRLLRRGLHAQPDVHGQRTLGVSEAPVFDLPDQVRECRLTLGHSMRRYGT
jgi:hypothetical protein